MPQRIPPTSNFRLTSAAGVAAVLLAAFAPALGWWPAAAPLPAPELVELPPGSFRYRAAGEFWRAGQLVAAPLLWAAIERPLKVMRQQVTAADYQRCVAAKACLPTDADDGSDRPIVKLSWRDADAYAAWLAKATGLPFRLPSDQEWTYAAGSRVADDAAADAAPPTDPGRRALALYDKDAGRTIDKTPQPIGSFGANEYGLLDLAGNVWEWTDTCFARTSLDANGEAVVNCGVRVVEGRHRAYMPDFIRDARAGGCSVGTPPSNIGLRLVARF
jgi:formylglycine-generating enzyme required for sulfatase activity